jgi:hypothetical protein
VRFGGLEGAQTPNVGNTLDDPMSESYNQ